jgi:hypothetical protein
MIVSHQTAGGGTGAFSMLNKLDGFSPFRVKMHHYRRRVEGHNDLHNRALRKALKKSCELARRPG